MFRMEFSFDMFHRDFPNCHIFALFAISKIGRLHFFNLIFRNLVGFFWYFKSSSFSNVNCFFNFALSLFLNVFFSKLDFYYF